MSAVRLQAATLSFFLHVCLFGAREFQECFELEALLAVPAGPKVTLAPNLAAEKPDAFMEVDGEIAGMLQLTFIPYLTHIGSWRCLIEGVRVHSRYRGQGLGRQFLKWAISRAKDRNCSIVQLTTDKTRPAAIQF